MRVLSAEEMPDDNARLASIEVEFSSLEPDSADSCPTGMKAILDYLAIEVPDGGSLNPSDLTFVRTARVEETSYWIWRFTEPDGHAAYATCSVSRDGKHAVGYETDYYGLTPEQFILTGADRPKPATSRARSPIPS